MTCLEEDKVDIKTHNTSMSMEAENTNILSFRQIFWRQISIKDSVQYNDEPKETEKSKSLDYLIDDLGGINEKLTSSKNLIDS